MPPRMVDYDFRRYSLDEMHLRADTVIAEMATRRSCRMFSDEPVPRDLIEKIVAIGHSAPSGANRQPWRFVAVDDPELKRKIRLAAEAEERESYAHRMPAKWLDALEPLGTGPEKPYLEIAPWLVVLFRIDWEEINGRRFPNYYPVESTGIAAGFFLMACHHVGLATLTHTPNPMGFLRSILGRPINEKPYLLIPVGYPEQGCTVPDVQKKPLSRVLQWNIESETNRED